MSPKHRNGTKWERKSVKLFRFDLPKHPSPPSAFGDMRGSMCSVRWAELYESIGFLYGVRLEPSQLIATVLAAPVCMGPPPSLLRRRPLPTLTAPPPPCHRLLCTTERRHPMSNQPLKIPLCLKTIFRSPMRHKADHISEAAGRHCV